ncbi:MAG: hypothetical protein SV375_14150 [Thermodesulfobacteriota bacterium]|nr:hypothetical protein [Thermodesulfobacteriota bacterium]
MNIVGTLSWYKRNNTGLIPVHRFRNQKVKPEPINPCHIFLMSGFTHGKVYLFACETDDKKITPGDWSTNRLTETSIPITPLLQHYGFLLQSCGTKQVGANL